MKKDYLIGRAHDDYAKLQAAMNDILQSVNKAKDLVMEVSSPSAGVAMISLNNIHNEIGSINAGFCKDYIEELASLQQKTE